MRKKNSKISLFLLLIPSFLFSQSLLLTPPFYTIKNSQATTRLSIDDTYPIFYIIVPESYTLPSTSKKVISEMELFTQNVKVPSELFSTNKPPKEVVPGIIFFDWKEQESINGRKKAGKDLAEKINYLQQRFKTAQFIVTSFGQGSNVVNNATHSLRKPLDIVIQLMPPVLSHKITSKVATKLLPHKSNILQLYTFYSDHEFCMLHPKLHPNYEHSYQNPLHDKHKNSLLLINNDHPLPTDTMCPLIGQKLFLLCKKMKQTYPHHNHLISHISNTKSDTDMMIMLKDRSLNTNDRKFAKEIQRERIISTMRKKQFEKTWKRPLKVSLSKKEITHRSYDSIKKLANNVKVS